MMPIFICEDDPKQKQQLTEIIRNYLMIEELDMQLILATEHPNEILDFLVHHPDTVGIYFLDIDLKSELNGIELAAKIRELDAVGKIIFVTTHDEMAPLTFRYKVEAFDYIIKANYEQVQKQIIDCLDTIDNRKEISSNVKEQFVFKSGTKSRAVNYQDILYFETLPTPHIIGLRTAQAHYQFYGRLKEIEKQLPHLVRVHKSILANLEAVIAVDRDQNLLEFAGGENCPVAISKIRKVHAMWEKLQT